MTVNTSTNLTVQDAVEFAAKLLLQHEVEFIQKQIRRLPKDSSLRQIKRKDLAVARKMLNVLEEKPNDPDPTDTWARALRLLL